MSTVADVIVIGGGPAGVAAAVEMRRRGLARVVLLDREPELGGATRHCSHSPFGMREFGRVYFGAAYGRRLAVEAARAGVEVRTGHSVVRLEDGGRIIVTSPRGIEEMTARRLMIATGVRETPRSAQLIAGDRPIGVVTTGTLQAYVAFHGLVPFRRPVVFGSELVSLSAVMTCLTHGVRPVAMLESASHALAQRPFSWFPKLVGVPLHYGARILDIRGTARVEEVSFRRGDGTEETLPCDGVLLTGRFTPEAALIRQSFGIDAGSSGPAIDQDGRSTNPSVFASGNVLRAVETGGWAFREGRSVGAAIAEDLSRGGEPGERIAVVIESPMKLVVPSMLRRGGNLMPAFHDFQLRFERRARGRLTLELDGHEVWAVERIFMPERRILVPIPSAAFTVQGARFRFREQL